MAEKTATPSTNDERAQRRARRQALIDAGVQPYPIHSTVTAHAADLEERYAELPDGTDYVYESTSRKKLEAYRAGLMANARGEAPRVDAVCIVGETREGTLLMIREFRYPLNSWCIAFPAGLKEPNESIRECVDRELREETGYRLRTDVDEPVRLLPQAGFSSTGLTDEAIQIVFAQVEKAGDAQPEESELIAPFQLPLSDVRRFLDENTTLIGTRAQLILEVFAARTER